MRTAQRGFSLIELLIVVAIILVIAAIAIPNLVRSRIAANQASAIESLRVIGTAEVTYASTYGGSYTSTLSELGPPATGAQASSTAAGLLDDLLATGAKSGYTYTYTPGTPDATGKYNGYTVQANPSVYGQSGSAYFFTDETHVIRSNTTSPASSTDTPVAQ